MEKYVYEKNKLPKPVIEGHNDWVELYYKAWELAFKNIDYIKNEGWKPQLTCMPGVGIIWQWDSCFMVMITKYANGTISALNNLDNIYRLRRKEDGFIGMAYVIDTEEEAYAGRINPPLLAWAEWEYYLVSGDSSRFEKVIPAIEGLYEFIEANRRREGCGLYWFEDSGSSGMDNSPRSGYFCPSLNGSDVCFVDLACQQALTAKCLAKMLEVLGKGEKARFYISENERICELINQFHWHEKSGFYYDFFARDSIGTRVKFINSKTVAAVWTLLSGAAKEDKVKRLNEHFFNEDEFYTKIPFASLSKDDLNYDETGGYWLGGVWPPTNYALIKGLYESGCCDKSKEAAERFLNGMCRVYENPEYKTIWEAYCPEEFKPSTTENGERVRSDFVGWGGLAPITMLIENIIGLKCDAQNNEVEFRILNDGESGMENLLFNGGYISVVCKEHRFEKGKTSLYVSAEKPFRLTVFKDGQTETIDVKVGESNFLI